MPPPASACDLSTILYGGFSDPPRPLSVHTFIPNQSCKTKSNTQTMNKRSFAVTAAAAAIFGAAMTTAMLRPLAASAQNAAKSTYVVRVVGTPGGTIAGIEATLNSTDASGYAYAGSLVTFAMGRQY
jgi:hypothetical protein